MVLLNCDANFRTLKPEDNIYLFTTEDQLLSTAYSQSIEDFYNSGQSGTFLGAANIPIYYNYFLQEDTPSPAIVISSGRTEAAIKYKELIFDLFNQGYTVYIHDHRGQGLSGRLTEDRDMGFVDEFQYYIDDLHSYYSNFVAKQKHSAVFLLAHSMGGAIGMRYLQQYPDTFKAASFSSPMLGFIPGTCRAVNLLNSDTPEYAITQGKYNDDKVEFKNNTLTGSEIRYNRMLAAYKATPKARLGGATYQWLHKSCLEYTLMRAEIKALKTPFILFSADTEEIVDPKAHEAFVTAAQKMEKTCKAYLIENAQHELLIEKDEQRIEVLNETLNYFNTFKN
ncbi:MAG: hypothetical protein BM564_02855 [Bacteroidetes bacterium MedPE-SWsnd-G2]|nr:MAG: hypothetical protein BM564_02855 [Bacteroidetes bacterium MedPE-SWsnd-G2]